MPSSIKNRGKIEKILLQIRPDYLDAYGGDSTQLLKTREALMRCGIQVDISTELEPDLTEYDLVHLFNITRIDETYYQALNAFKQDKPMVLSVIYWTLDELENCKGIPPILFENDQGLSKIKESILSTGKSVNTQYLSKNSWERNIFKNKQRVVLHISDVLLPNSRTELDLLKHLYNLSSPKYHIVPNAADLSFGEAKCDEFVKKYGLKDFVLCVGRIERRKNQLSLLYALCDTDIPIVLVGDTLDKEYFSLCQKYASEKTLFLGSLKHNELGPVYAAAKVHALPSWYETPGLTNLEAALAGCNIVCTNRGSTKEYFGELARYCNPTDPESIKKVVCEAFYSPRQNKLKDLVAARFTWDKAAEETILGYELALKTHSTKTHPGGRRRKVGSDMDFEASKEVVENLELLAEQQNTYIAHLKKLVDENLIKIANLERQIAQNEEQIRRLSEEISSKENSIRELSASLERIRSTPAYRVYRYFKDRRFF